MKPVAIITGAASNIGLAIANRFTFDYQVLGIDLKFQPEKTEESSYSFEHYQCDITNLSDLAAAIKHARKMGQISAVVHSAAITEPRATIKDISVDSWRRVIEVNLSATFFLMKLIAPDLEASRGAGVFIASRAGKAGYAGFDPTPLGTKAHYCASKAGVDTARLHRLESCGSRSKLHQLNIEIFFLEEVVSDGSVKRNGGNRQKPIANRHPIRL